MWPEGATAPQVIASVILIAFVIHVVVKLFFKHLLNDFAGVDVDDKKVSMDDAVDTRGKFRPKMLRRLVDEYLMRTSQTLELSGL